MNPSKLLAIIAAAIAFTGCTSMTPTQCQVADWGRQGHTDGASGQNQSRIAAYTEDCAKAGVRPDAQIYRSGWDAGIQQYCTAASGWSEGLKGIDYKAPVCAGTQGQRAYSYYLAAGLQLHITDQQIERNYIETQHLENRLQDAKTTDKEKRNLRDQLADLDHNLFNLRRLKVTQQQVAP